MERRKMPYLPDDVIFDIISRLPVKSLMRFKCVCQQWCSLFSDPQSDFRKTHLQRTKEGRGNVNSYKALMPSIRFGGASVMDFEDSPVMLEYPIGIQGSKYKTVEILGSYDGLVCLVFDYKNCMIWNPSTREYKLLASPISSSIDGVRISYYSGFGFGSSIDDYKVVLGVTNLETVDDEVILCNEVQVLNLKSNKWKSIFQKVDQYANTVAIFLNKSLHWLIKRRELNNRRNGVLSFSMEEEKFMEILTLPEVFKHHYSLFELTAFENSLFLFGMADWESVSLAVEVWENKDYRLEECWTKLYSVQNYILPALLFDHLYITKTRKFTLAYFDFVDAKKVVTYDFEERTIGLWTLNSAADIGGIVYLETLVSPN